MAKLDTGFFNLYLFSSLYIENKTHVEGLIAFKNSVLNASALSNVYMKGDVRIMNNLS